MAQTVQYFIGFETGSTSEINAVGSGGSIQSTTVRSGAYALSSNVNSSNVLTAALSATQWVCRVYCNFSNPTQQTTWFKAAQTNGATATLNIAITAAAKLQVIDANAIMGFSTVTGTRALVAGTWYRIEAVVDQAAGGVIKVYIDGVLEINTTHSADTTAGPTTRISLLGNTTCVAAFDDVRFDAGGLSLIGAGHCVARQPVTGGTPTYDQWTKSSGSDAGALWNETPFGTTNNCSDSTSGHAQTAVIARFSTVQSGHGQQVITSRDTVNAAKAAIVFKRATSGSPSIRRRVNGTDTDTVVAGATTDAYKDDGIWTTTVANLDLLEAGMVKAADANLTTVEDVWVIVDYTPAFKSAWAGSSNVILGAEAP